MNRGEIKIAMNQSFFAEANHLSLKNKQFKKEKKKEKIPHHIAVYLIN